MCCDTKLRLPLTLVSRKEKTRMNNNNSLCAVRAPFAGGVKAHCACWQQGLNSPVLSAQPFATDTTELQELPTVLPVNLGTSSEKGAIKQCSNMLEVALYSWCICKSLASWSV